MKIIFLTGRSCVGKSTFASSLEKDGAVVVRTSAVAEKLMSFSDMAKSADPTAPPQVEDAILREVENTIRTCRESHVYVDAAPRNVSQVKWVESLARKYTLDSFEIWYCFCNDSVRQERVRKGLTRDGKRDLTKARLVSEDTNCVSVLECLFSSEVAVKLVDLSTNHHVARSVGSDTDLVQMFGKHAEFNDMVMRRFNTDTASLMKNGSQETMEPFGESAVWASRFLVAARNEIDEALHEIPAEWWTVDMVNNSRLREEIIDVWHFLMSAAFAAGLNAESFTKEYYRKRTINVNRQHSGKYSKKNKPNA